MIRAVFLLCALLIAASAEAQVNKCIGAYGKIIYSQDPCPAGTRPAAMGRDVRAATPQQASAPATPGEKAGPAKSDAPRTAAEEEQAFRKRQQEQAKEAKEAQLKAEQSQQKQANCRNARESLATLESGSRISQFNAAGERYYLDDAQIEQQKASARQTVAQACN
jgi:uncharacterized protein YaiL (DUF2058 family)